MSKPACRRQAQNVTSEERQFIALWFAMLGFPAPLLPCSLGPALRAGLWKGPAADFPRATGSHTPPKAVMNVCLIINSFKSFEGNIY